MQLLIEQPQENLGNKI